MVCVSMQRGEYTVFVKGNRLMDASWPESLGSRLGEKELCWYVRGM